MKYYRSVCLCIFLILSGSEIRSEQESIPVGVAEVDITPEYPVRLSGFGGRRTESEGINQRIWAKALAFGDAKEGPAILITAENLTVPDEITLEVARRLASQIGLKKERLAITATHTHTAPMLKNVCPTLFGVPIPAEHQKNIDRYTAEFTDALEKVAIQAFQEIRPARVGWGIGTVDFAVNRRTKGGPVDHDLPTLAVYEPDGNLRAVYFSYACHCVTLSHNKISGDWAGFAQDRVEELFPGTIAMASIGCGADSNPSSGVTGDKVAVCAEQGDQIAQEVKRLLRSHLKPIRSGPTPRYTRIDLPLAPARSREEWERRAKQQDAVGHHARVNLERLNRGEPIPDKINYPIQTWVFGDDLAMVFLPGETVVDYSVRLKREFDRTRLWINGYSNEGRAYVPSERILKEGGYEGGDAMIYYDFPQKFAPGLEQVIIDAVTAQIPQSFKAPPGTEGTRPLSPEQALRSFRTKPGLKIELVAAEPLVQDPVAIDWGADGKLWVCEMHDYPSGLDANWQPGGRVKFLVDENGDGQYDRATIFLDRLPFPTGVTAWGRGVLICAAPDILYAEDTNNDGKADKVEKLFTGFFTDNFQARVNSLTLGLDNWIYGANGLLGGEIAPVENSLFSTTGGSVNIRNRDFRIHPFRGTFETASGLTQQGRVRDDWGNWFGCDNSRLLLHFPVAESYLRRNPHVATAAAVRDLTARPGGNRLFPSSPLLERFNDPDNANRVTSACGLGIYRDVLLGEEYYGNAFICEPVHNLVHREVLKRDAIITSQRPPDEENSEFLSSTDNWFRPAQVRPGPDGALYIVDMYRFLIEHPRWIPAARLAEIDIRAGADRGRIYRIVSENHPLRPIRDLTKVKADELASALETPNGMERDRVHIELLLRQDRSAAPRLKELAVNARRPQVRLQSLAALDGLAALELEQVQIALHDPDPGVREHALRLSEQFLRGEGSYSAAALKSILSLTNDPSILVLRQLAFTLGESRRPEAGHALGVLARRWLTNVEIRTAVMTSAAQHCDAILTMVMGAEDSAPGRAEWITPLVATAANSKSDEVVSRAIRACLPLTRTKLSEGEMNALATLLENLLRKGTSVDRLLDQPTRERLRAALEEAATIAAEGNAPERTRQAAIGLVGALSTDNSLALLTRLATSPSESVRRAAISALKRWRSPAVASQTIRYWQDTTPAARTELIALLLDRPEWTLALLNAVRDGVVPPHEFSRSDRQRLAASEHAEIRKLAQELLPTEPISARAEVLEQYKTAVQLVGTVASGAEVFRKNCAACHALNGIGQNVGPDLAVLRGRDADYWIKNILDPNAVIEPRFVTYEIDLKDDRSVSGLIKNENATSLTIVAGTGASETVLRSEIVSIRASTLSLMPEGLEQGISPQEMADLIAFARSGNPRKQIAGNDPQVVKPGADGVLMLAARQAEIYGQDITFETQFQNIGMWHSPDDQVAWTFDLKQAGRYDVYLDYASAANALGNSFLLELGEQSLSGKVVTTGEDWSNYEQKRIGTVQLMAGTQRAVVRSAGPIRGGLIDLRTVALAPAGKSPKWPGPPRPPEQVLRDPSSVARFVLDSSQPEAARSAAVTANPQFAAALIQEMTRDLKAGTPEEYARIPWIWRVAIACGKRNDAGQIKGVIEASLPTEDEPLRDWQAVVLGGGIINGLSQRGLWPAERINEILASDAAVKARWVRALELSARMADDEKVPTGTRYDALRMLALEGWDKRGSQLLRYLAKGTHAELQMGAVSGLVDVDAPEAADALIKALPYLQGENRKLAIDGLTRDEERKAKLLLAVKSGELEEASLGEAALREP